jgi:hypothetical protein
MTDDTHTELDLVRLRRRALEATPEAPMVSLMPATVLAICNWLDELERLREALDEAEDGNIAQTLANYRAIRRAALAGKKEMPVRIGLLRAARDFIRRAKGGSDELRL